MSINTKSNVPFVYSPHVDKPPFAWNNFTSVPYDCSRSNGRTILVPQPVFTGNYYTFDQLRKIIGSARHAMGDITIGQIAIVSAQTRYVARCGPPRASVIYRIGLDE
jgi:hypothetical protein